MVATPSSRVKLSGFRPLVALAVAAGIFWLAYDAGSYTLESRATVAIVLLWGILLAFGLGLWPFVRPPLAALVAGGLLVAFTLFTGLSLFWAESAERALVEFNRAVLLTAFFAVAVLAGTRGNLGRWLDGIALALAAIGVLALASRLFPDELPAGAVPDFLPSAISRLSWPVEYWNGLAILVALAVPLLLRVATTSHPFSRGAAVGVVPALAGTLFLTSSRGGFAVALVGTLAFFVLGPRRLGAAAAALVALAGSAAAVAILHARDELVNDPYGSSAAVGQGRSAAGLLLLVCLATGAVYAVASLLLASRRAPRLPGWAAAALVLVLAVGAVALADPVRRFDEFREPPAELAADDFVQAHLLSGSGSGRWQFWTAAVEQWRERPLAGHGAGSFEAWWAQHGTIPYFLRDAHSLYLETLGELGLVGFLLLAGALATGLVAGLRRLLAAADEEEAVAIAAVLAAYGGFLLGAGIDWMWELTVVSAVGLILLGLATGPATSTTAPRLAPARVRPREFTLRRYGAGIAAVVAGWFLIFVQAIPLLTQYTLASSQAAVREDDLERALDRALAGRQLQPWAASPYLQLALVHEQRDDLPAAQAAIGEAIERDPLDWRLWLVSARLQAESGEIAAARASLARAIELNPRSPLFANAR